MAKKKSRNARCLLTVREVMTAKEGDHSDGGNLYLRIRGDAASWLYRYTGLTGRRREMGLGPAVRGDAADVGEGLTKAREAADEARKVLAAGKDPIDVRALARGERKEAVAVVKAQVKAAALTLARASRTYHAKFIEPRRSARHSAEWIASLERHVPKTMWHSPLATVRPGELLDVIVELDARIPETAGRVLQRLDAVFDDALLRELTTSNPAAAIRRKLRELTDRRTVTHFRSLPFTRLRSFMQDLQAVQSMAALALRFLILTASRSAEVLQAAWSEIDLEERAFRIAGARMKGREDHVVYLSDAAHALLKAHAEDPSRDPTWIFPSPTGNGEPMTSMVLLIVLRRMGMDKATTVHGFRATFSTWANESGYRSDVIEACLAHKEEDKVRRAYNRAKFVEERKTLLADWADYCMATNVIELKNAA